MWTWEATVRLAGCHDFTIRIMAPCQITAKNIIEAQYGIGCIIGNNVWRIDT